MDNRQPASTYLNYRNVFNGNAAAQNTAVPARRPPPPPPPPAVQSISSTLLIFISDAPSPDIHVYLATILSRYSIGEIVIIATSEETLKASRMDVYTAAGKMKQDVVVTTSIISTSLTSSELLKATIGLENKTLSGVLCCQHTAGKTHDTEPRDILDYDEAELEASWRAGLMTLHTLARLTIPILRRAPLDPTPFFCLDSTIQLSPLDTIAQEALLDKLSASPASQGLRFGSAKEELIPAPAPAAPLTLDIPNNQSRNGSNGNYNGGVGYNVSPISSPGLSESPTKLWASWAMMNE